MTATINVGEQLSFQELGTALHETTFVVFDLETTGMSADGDAVTEIGAIKIRGGEVLGEFATLVNPQRIISPSVSAITGITHEMVDNAPTMATALPAFLEFAAGAVLVAHNASFDIGFLRAACQRYEYPWQRPTVICTVRLARKTLTRQEAPSCKLSALAALFGAATQPTHRALDDARATVDVLHGLLSRVGSLGVHSLEELSEYLTEVTPAQRNKRELAAHISQEPGVYLFRGPSHEVLYVGTAINLQRRVRQYFTASESRSRMREMVTLATRVDTVVCAHALEAQIRELRLLAAYRPAYNRRSKNPHRGWWVVLTDEPFPRLSVVRAARDDALGPFGSRATARIAVEALQDAVPIRPCNQRIPARDQRGTPCALAELKLPNKETTQPRCAAPCAGKQDPVDYAPAVVAIHELITGQNTTVLDNLATSLDALCAQERFEAAGSRRDRMITLVRALDRGQRMAALAAIPELVAAQPDGQGGWAIAVLRYGRLASAGVALRGIAPIPVVNALVAAAETILPSAGPLRGAPAEETALLLRWLEVAGTRLVRTAVPWAEPANSAARWRDWVEKANQARTFVAVTPVPWYVNQEKAGS